MTKRRKRTMPMDDAVERVVRAMSAFVAVTSYRIAHSPFSGVSPDEKETFETLHAELRELIRSLPSPPEPQ